MRRLSFIVLLIVVSCNDTKNEIIDLNDIQAQSENYKEGTIGTDSMENIVEVIPTNLNHALLTESGINCENRVASDTLLFPDRFSPIYLSKFDYSVENETINFSQYNFKDSVKTQNVFLNWSNCFGAKCNSIRIGETKNLQKNGFLMMINDTCIVYISTNSSAEKKNWLNYFTHEKDIRWKYILTQNKQGKVKWQSYSENDFVSIAPIILND